MVVLHVVLLFTDSGAVTQVSLGLILAVHSLSVALNSAFTIIGILLSATAEIQDMRWQKIYAHLQQMKRQWEIHSRSVPDFRFPAWARQTLATKAPRKSPPATGRVKQPHTLRPGTIALRKIQSRSAQIYCRKPHVHSPIADPHRKGCKPQLSR
ncbi:hypothetical protein SLA2020_263440 [Shorea laevis]